MYDLPLALVVSKLNLLERTLLDGGTSKVAEDGQSADCSYESSLGNRDAMGVSLRRTRSRPNWPNGIQRSRV